MTQDEKWIARHNEVMEFIQANHRNPSKHRMEEHDMLNWLKQQRKLHNAEAARYSVPWQKLIKVKKKQLTQKMRGFSGNLTNFANGMR